MDKRPYRPSVRVIILKGNLVAVGKWMQNGKNCGVKFPGGGVDEGETYEQAAVKECLEEVGILVEDVVNLGYRFCLDKEFKDPERRKKFRGSQDDWMLGRYVKMSDKLHDSQGDAFDVEWVTVDEAIKRVNSFSKHEIAPAQLKALELTKNFLSKPKLKAW